MGLQLQFRWLTFGTAQKLPPLPWAGLGSATRKKARTLDSVALWWGRLSSNEMIILAVVIAVLLRIGVLSAAHAHGLVIDSEGSEYARIAQNLRSGHGYVGIFNNGAELNDAPLFPLLIAALSFILPSAEMAARVISIAGSATLVIPMFKLAGRMYNRRVATLATVLVVFHPLFVARSILCCSETFYLTLLMFGLYCSMLWFDEYRLGTSILAGVFFGLAYLMRPEALLFAAAFGAAGLVLGLFTKARRTVLIGVLIMAGVFTLLAAPYIAFLSIHTGAIRIEGKGALAYAWGTRMNSGMSYQEATTKIADDLTGVGVYMMPYSELLNTTSYSFKDLLAYLLRSAPRNLKIIYYELMTTQSQGAPLIWVMAVLGLVRSPWDRKRLMNEGILLLSVVIMVLTLLSVQSLPPRYYHSIVGILLLWTAKGADELYDWARNTFAVLSMKKRVPRLAGLSVQWTAVFLLFALSLRSVIGNSEFGEAMRTDRKVVGQWLAQQSPRPKWVMDTSLLTTYYSGAGLMYLPYSSSNIALHYIAEKHPDFIVLLQDSRRSTPYLAQWFDKGIPDHRAELIYDKGDTRGERVKVYRWDDRSGRDHAR
jgi:4-amino-4-deoxy-L-arabinose transferase-like glycosyltransferase